MLKKSNDFLLQTIINIILLGPKKSFWEVKRSLVKFGFNIDKACLLKRLNTIYEKRNKK